LRGEWAAIIFAWLGTGLPLAVNFGGGNLPRAILEVWRLNSGLLCFDSGSRYFAFLDVPRVYLGLAKSFARRPPLRPKQCESAPNE
jgi:hypothetical protein